VIRLSSPCENITFLNLNCNELTEFPTIAYLTSITRLSLRSNQFSEIPSTIGDLSRMVDLNLSFNSLTRLPSTIGALTNLTRLDVSGNQISEIPATIGNLAKLCDLDLSIFNLKTLPLTIGNLANLDCMKIFPNQLELQTSEEHAMYIAGKKLIFHWNWTVATHHNFAIQVRDCVKLVVLEARSNYSSNLHKLPKEILLHMLSFLEVHKVVNLPK
jgi:Leucine-rich repeat (LRR) protein